MTAEISVFLVFVETRI